MDFSEFIFKERLKEQRELFTECFPETIGSPAETDEHYLWKHQSRKLEMASCEYIATDKQSNIIGYYAAIPYRYDVNGTILFAAMVCDVMTGVKARGKGIFTKLGQYSIDSLRKKNFHFSTGYPIRPEVIPGHLRVGWVIPFKLPMYGKLFRFDHFLANKNMAYLTSFANLILRTVNVLFSINIRFNNKISTEIYYSTQLRDINGLEDYFTKLCDEIPIYLKKDIEFLSWRLGAPSSEYNIIILREKGDIIGHSISRRVIKQKIPCLGIIDIGFMKGYEKYAATLFSKCEEIALNQGAEMALVMLGKKWAKKYNMFFNGYFKTPFTFSFIINRLNNFISDELLFDSNNWNLMWIDSDDL